MSKEEEDESPENDNLDAEGARNNISTEKSSTGDTIEEQKHTQSSCERIKHSLKTMEFYLERAKLLDAYEESIRLQELLAFCSETDHSSECALEGACPLLPGKHKDSLRETFSLLEERSAMIQKVITETHEFSHSAQQDGGEDCGECEDDGGWVLGADMFGIKTYYKTDELDGRLNLRMEAEQEVPVFEQMAVLYESELYSDWIPFCSSSSLVKKISHTEQVFHTHFTTPVALRDMLIRVYASDCVLSHGCVVFVGRSVTDLETTEDTDTVWPSHPNYFLGCRVEVQQLSGVLRMTSSKSAKSVILMKVDPKLHLPQMVINFLIKKMAGVFLYFLQKKAVSLAEEASGTKCKHAQRMQSNTAFYVDWLLPVVRAYCQVRGWTQFTVQLLGAAGRPLEGRDYRMPEVALD